jgi:hypothetical protein
MESKMATSRDPKETARGVEAKGTADAAAQRKAGKDRGDGGGVRKTHTAGKKKSAAEKPAVPAQKKEVITAEEGIAVIEGSAQANTENAEGKSGKVRKISRQALIERAFEKLKERLDSKDAMTPAMIGVLEKLLKLDRDVLDETEMPQEIRVLWEETDDDPEQDQ